MTRQNILLIILILCLAGIVFIWYEYLYVASSETVAPQTEFQGQLVELRRLKELQLDTTILNDPLFQSLQPYPTTDMTGLKPGRTNPFLPF